MTKEEDFLMKEMTKICLPNCGEFTKNTVLKLMNSYHKAKVESIDEASISELFDGRNYHELELIESIWETFKQKLLEL